MKKVTFISDFSFDVDTSTRTNYPEGWSGSVEDDVAEAAAAAEAIETEAKGKKAKAVTADAAPADLGASAGAGEAPPA